MSASISVPQHAATAVADIPNVRFGAAAREDDERAATALRKVAGFVEDVVFLLFVVLMFPVGLILIGHTVVEIARRL